MGLTKEDIKIMRSSDISISLYFFQDLEKISDDISDSELNNIEKLSFNNVTIKEIPYFIFELKKIKYLDLSNSQVPLEFMSRLSVLPKLKHLNISNNLLFRKNKNAILFDFLNKLNLETLIAKNIEGKSHNFKNIGKLSSLRNLDISHNYIKSIRSFKLNKHLFLKKLNLSNNYIGNIYSSQLSTISLTDLDISHNQIPKIIFNINLSKLKNINIEDNSKEIFIQLRTESMLENLQNVHLDDRFATVSSSIKTKFLATEKLEFDRLITEYKSRKSKWNKDAYRGVKQYIKPLEYKGLVVENTNTHLLWDVNNKAKEIPWKNAISLCKNKALDINISNKITQLKDWRLPTMKELLSIIDYKIHTPMVRSSDFSMKSKYYWTSSSKSEGYAWYINFKIGVAGYTLKTDKNFTVCVRDSSTI